MPVRKMTAIVVHKSEFHVSGSDDIVRVRQEVRKKAQELKFSIVDQTKLITAASELARNMILYAEQGDVIMEVLRSEGREGIRLIFTDKGPGIADVELALSDWVIPHQEEWGLDLVDQTSCK
jgi:serine/threonine-protein kinase RsbT